MTEIMKKLIEGGLIDVKIVKDLERWGHLDEGLASLVGSKKPKTTLERSEFIDEVSEILDRALEEPPKETRLEIHSKTAPIIASLNGLPFPAVMDLMGHLICPPELRFVMGDFIRIDNSFFIVETVEGLYEEQRLIAWQLSISPAKGSLR